MKKTLIVGSLFASAAFFSCNTSTKSIKTEMDSVAYAVGIDLGGYVKNLDSTLDVKYIAQGIQDMIDNKSVMDVEDAYAFLREYFMVRRPAKTQKESEEFIEKAISGNSKAVKTESGLIYEIVEAGSGEKPTDSRDTVVVSYVGKLPNGTEFDSSAKHGRDAEFPLTDVIPAWTEGIQLIGKGGQIKLWVPSNLAYGERGAGNAIGPNQALYFEVELIDIKPFVDRSVQND